MLWAVLSEVEDIHQIELLMTLYPKEKVKEIFPSDYEEWVKDKADANHSELSPRSEARRVREREKRERERERELRWLEVICSPWVRNR